MSFDTPKSSALRELRDLNIDDLLKGLGWQDLARRLPPLRRLFDAPSTKLARIILSFDRLVGELGIASAAAVSLGHLGVSVNLSGQRPISTCLHVSNHPGLYDALALLSIIGRDDLKIIAISRPFLRQLPNLARHFLFLPPDGGGTQAVIRMAVTHLRNGGGVLTFPAGAIETDPAWNPRASDSLREWSVSTNLFSRLVPGLLIQPWVVSGVHHPEFLKSPLLKIRRRPHDRPWLAAVLQLSFQMMFPRRFRVRINIAGGSSPAINVQAVMAEVHTLLQQAYRQI